MITADTTVNEAVQMSPDALRIFSNIGIDACCGGPLALREVAKRHVLDLDELLRAVNKSAPPACSI